jgi:autotransporter adhesin
VALGANSLADRDNTVSVGAAQAWSDTQGGAHAAFTRQITNVSAGTEATDAVNVAQLDQAIAGVGGHGVDGTAVARAFGGGASYGPGGLSGPSYLIQNRTYADVGGALSALDGSLTDAWKSIKILTQHHGDGLADAPRGGGNGLAIGGDSVATDPRDTAVGTGATIGADGSTAVGSNAVIDATATNAVAIGADTHVSAPSGTAVGQGASSTAQNSVALGAGSVADQANTVSVGNAGAQRRITNVAAGVAPTDAANTAQVDQALEAAKTYADTGDTATLAGARSYTDQRFANTVSTGDFNAFRSQVDDRFHRVDRRVDRIGAMGAASTQMAINAAGVTSSAGRVAVGAGTQSGQHALSVGYATQIGERTRMSIGGAFSGSENSAGVGFGVDL